MTIDPNAANQPTPPTSNPPAAERPVWERLGYTNELELERAVYNSRSEGSRLAARVSELENDYRVMPSQAAAARRPSDELATIGIPTDALDAYVDERLNARLRPVLATNQALNRVKAENPDFARFEPQWNAWLSAHPEVNQRLQDALSSAPDNADFILEGAFSRFAREARMAAPQPPNGTTGPMVPTDATLPVTQGSGAATRGPAEQNAMPSREDFELMRQRARRGDQRAQLELMKLAVGTQIHPELPPAR